MQIGDQRVSAGAQAQDSPLRTDLPHRVKLFWRSARRASSSSSSLPERLPAGSAGRPPGLARERARGATRETPGGTAEEEALAEIPTELATALYRVAPTIQLEEGQALFPGREERPASFLVSGGGVELGGSFDGRWLPLARLDRGSCIRLPSPTAERGDVELELGIRSVGRATLLDLRAGVLRGIAPEARAAVALRAAASASACTAELLRRLQCTQAGVNEISRSLAALRARSRAAVARKEVGEGLAALPRLPLHATELMQRLLAPGARSNEIAELIREDPPLASLVLKTVNSPYFGLRTKVADCYRALLLLGVNQIYQMVLDSGVRSALPPTPQVEAVQAHSYLVSLLAHDLANAVGVAPQVAATVGLLHDLGKMVAPQLASNRPALEPLVDLLDEAALGAALLRLWKVPEEVAAVIDRQHEPEVLPPDELREPLGRELRVLHIAHVCAERIAGPAPAEARPAPFLDRHIESLGRTERSAEELLEHLLRPALLKQARTLPRPVRVLLGLGDPAPEPEELGEPENPAASVSRDDGR